ncbi:SDR family NAD(P)-dependent oxidoreductase [Xanthocytophaga flava]|uniref:SDR family NAD(P)-dependent oxidoreductase n=1 Tax=Xanthocytophaga flava TaxID=3048013 RepID=UPI0028D0B64D|nr:SDR family NAD(P)-dependent oxidoreductase [Xanthocytophaga flavus]MDJ1469706.1 SDR family NAD(P)-dependent oxidoreductase [Xanthocytophaga flavus]
MPEQLSFESPQKNNLEPIAIIGIGCRFPGNVTDPASFWSRLQAGFDAITDVPENRWKLDNYYDPDTQKAGKIKSRKGGFLKEIDQFDASFFNIFPKEAERIDPQQRMLLEITYEAMEDAGVKVEDLSGSRTCVFMGVFTTDYWDMQSSGYQKDKISPHVAMGASSTSVANRLSYIYNLKGPSVSLNTACSSSLVAVHLACQSIWNGESSMGLAGGVNLLLKPETSILMSKGNFLSPDGYCKTFDSRANGYVRSEGCGVILLKPLSKALEDGDQIYSLIRATGVNQDGYTEDGFTVPNPDAQTELLETVYNRAGVNPAEITYVEAHGTGTPVGDPLETRAFGNVVGKGRNTDNKCVIGSVKTNMGHLEAAAGIAGLIKLALITKNRQIPANLHFEKPNPKIPFETYKLRVPTTLETIPQNIPVVYAGVNSFGAGGTNAHCLLQEYIPAATKNLSSSEDGMMPHLFLISAKNEKALKDLANSYIPFLKGTSESLQDICYSLATRRSSFEHKLSIAARTKTDASEYLEAFVKGETRQGMTYQIVKESKKPRIAFIYSGQGPQWFAMGQQLLKESSVFRDTILKIDALFSKIADWSLLEEMSRDEATSRVSDTRIAQPAIMAVQIGLTEIWKSWGIEADGCVGHSIGEVAAAYASGALTLEQAVEVIYHRSRNQNQATGKGKMLAVGLDLPSVKKEIKGLEAQIAIAAINGPQMIALAGDIPEMEQLAASLSERDIFNRFLQVNVPFHSHHMEPLKDEMIAALKHLQPSRTTIPLYSTVSGVQENGLHLVSEYWYKNVRDTVYFTQAIESMIQDGYDTFIEIAPHPVLTAGVVDSLKMHRIAGLVVPSLRRKEDEAKTMINSLGILTMEGYEANWKKLFPSAHYTKLPHYPWQHERYWFETKTHQQARLGTPVHPFLASEVISVKSLHHRIWNLNLNPELFTYLADHKVDGAIVFPGSGHLEIALSAGKASFPEHPVFLEDIHFDKALFLPEEGEQPEIRLEILNQEGEYYICSKQADQDNTAWIRHSRGKINYFDDFVRKEPVTIKPLLEKLETKISIPDFYVELKSAGLNYGETFRRVQKLWVKGNEILGAISLSSQTTYGVEQYYVHPALLDACLHTIFAARENTEDNKRGIYLPVHIEKYKVYEKPGQHVWTYVEILEASDDFLIGNYQILNEEGQLVAEMEGLTCKYIQGSRGEQQESLYSGMYEYQWEPLAQEDETNLELERLHSDECYLLFADTQGVSQKLLDKLAQDNLSVIEVTKGTAFKELSPSSYVINPFDGKDTQALFDAIHHKGLKVKKLFYLWALDNQIGTTITPELFEQQQTTLISGTMNLFQTIDRTGIKTGVVFLTQNNEKVEEQDTVINYTQAPIMGMSRVFINEYPYIPVKVIDIQSGLSEEESNILYTELTGKKFKFAELAIRNTQTYIRKLVPVTEAQASEDAAQEVVAHGHSFQTIVKRPGDLNSTIFQHVVKESVQADEVKIEVVATGLTQRDSLVATGKLDKAGQQLGFECAGIVRQVGSAITHLKEGDEVIAWGTHTLAGSLTVKANQVIKKPAHLLYQEAAGLPIAYITSYYALTELGRLSKEDAVLIQVTDWDVALASIQLATNTGAKVIVLAANDTQKTHLQKSGIEHVLTDQHTDFSQKVVKLTNGKGVDVVLNSLAGIGLIRGLKSLAPFGKFIDLSTTSTEEAILEKNRLDNNISFHTLDATQLIEFKPQLVYRIMDAVVTLFANKQLQSAPLKAFSIQELEKALSSVEDSTRIEKVIVNIDNQSIHVQAANTLTLLAEATYLITGGASGFGLEIARWLTAKGAKSLVLVSRSGPKSDTDRQVIKEIEATGTKVTLLQADITDYQAVQKIVATIQSELPPLKGIVHSAAMLDDQSIPDMSNEIFMKVYRPKVYGAWNFHEATKELPLDFFLMFSSISAIFGFPGQANYSSANNFLDRLAMYRQSIGLKASAANLGVLDDYAGMSKEGGRLIKALINQGWTLLSLKDVTSKLENVLLQQPPTRMLANLDWKRFRDFYYNLKDDTRFAHLMNESVKNTGGSGSSSLVDSLKTLSGEEQLELLTQKVSESLANILGVSAEKIDTGIPITKIGLDSLMLNQLRNWIQQKLEINFPLMKIAKGPSIVELSTQLLSEINNQEIVQEEAVSADTSGIAAEEDIEIYNQWLVRNKLVKEENVKYRIFCIHPVGAGASMFGHFIFNPPADAEVLAFQLPGRENRLHEEHYQDVPSLVADMATVMESLLDKPFIVFGHSFGGMVGFELIRHLQLQFNKKPIQLFISGTIAPQLTKKWKDRDVISETAVLTNSEERLLSLMSYIDDVEFLRKILPVMRKDMAMIMSYVYVPGEKFDFPITTFAADKDDVVYPSEVSQWKEHTNSSFTMEVLEGDHWFLSRNKELISQRLSDALEETTVQTH